MVLISIRPKEKIVMVCSLFMGNMLIFLKCGPNLQRRQGCSWNCWSCASNPCRGQNKLKGQIAWGHHWDTLVGFCGPNVNHVCVSNYKQVVELCEEGYNKMVDCFCTNNVGVFAKIVMVNPLH